MALTAVTEQGSKAQTHLIGGFFGEGRDKQTLRVYASGEQAGHAPGQDRGLARSCPGQHERRAVVVKKRLPLLRVQPGFQLGN